MSDKALDVSPYMGYSEDTKVRVWTDGTSSVAEVVQAGGMFENEIVRGRGVARRKKGDRRNPAVGVSLAIGRALKDASEHLERALNKEGYTL